MEKLSFVIPCYNSEQYIESVINEIISIVNEKNEYDYEIIAVNDCSPDNVVEVLKNLAKKNKKIKVIDLAKNRGKHAAMMAGYSLAQGEYIVNLDDDGQCPIENLWELLKPLKSGYDIAIASYRKKMQSNLKNFGSYINKIMANLLIEQPKNLNITNFSIIKRYVALEILKYDKPYPYMAGLFIRTTSKIINIQMDERERISGNTGYTLKRSLSLWLNGFTAFSVKPLRIATVMGFFIAMIGFIFGTYTIINKLLNPKILAGYSSIMAALLFIGGMIMLMLGLLGEYVGRIYICINNSPQYVIRDRVNLDEE